LLVLSQLHAYPCCIFLRRFVGFAGELLSTAGSVLLGDIFVPEFDNYGDAYLDVSVINITYKSHLAKVSKGLLMGADIRYVEKISRSWPSV
jgi:hypothetical protein